MNAMNNSIAAASSSSVAATTQKKSKKKPEKSSSKISAKDMPNVPIFLRKTYKMIDSCDPEIASWTDDGLCFQVKDTEKFAAQIIPEFFKHARFSSFVRQANAYGFKKLRNERERLRDETPEESKYWRFHHDKFRRGRPDLLSEIKKSNHNESAEKQEVDHLRTEVCELRGHLNSVSMELRKLRSLVVAHAQQQLVVEQAYSSNISEPANKKIKLLEYEPATSVPDAPVVSESTVEVKPMLVASNSNPGSSVQEILVGDPLDALYSESIVKPDIPARSSYGGPSSSAGSAPSLSLQDEQFLASIFALDFDDEVVEDEDIVVGPDVMTSSLSSLNSITDFSASVKNEVDAQLIQKLRNALATLPREMQEQFVERMVHFVADPEAVQRQVHALTSLALAASEEAKKRLEGTDADRNNNDSRSIELAGAIFGTYLAKYMGRLEPKNSTPSVFAALDE